MPGPEIQANAISTACAASRSTRSRAGSTSLLIVVLGMLAPLSGLRLAPCAAARASSLVAAALFLGRRRSRVQPGRIVSFVYPLGTLVLSSVGALGGALPARGVRARAGARRVRALRARGGRRPGARAAPTRTCGSAASRCEGTVMFSDLRGFTTFSEALPPARVIECLNRYLTEMSEAILDHGGTLVAYMGDGIMAVFGAPIEQDDHADRALAAAREMLDARLRGFNEWLREQGLQRRLQDGHRPQQRPGHVRQRRLRAPPRVHGDRRHDEHRRAPRGHDQGHAAPALRRRLDPRARSSRRPTTSSTSTSSRSAGARRR